MNLFTNNTIIYFVVYVIYFLGLVVGALIIDRLGLMDGIVEKLGESVHRFFLKYELDIYRGEREVVLHSLDSEDDLNSKGIFHGCLASVGLAKVAPQSESKVPDSVSKSKHLEGITGASTPSNSEVSVKSKRNCIEIWMGGVDPLMDYNNLFEKKLLTTKALYGCESSLICTGKYSNDFRSDFLFYLCNHHAFLSMFSASHQIRLLILLKFLL